MLKSVGLYSINKDEIFIRLPNPNDIIINWSKVSVEFQKEFLLFWHQTYVLSQDLKIKHHSYQINPLAYKNLMILDHIGYQVNDGEFSKESSFEDAYDIVLRRYDAALRLITSV